jgi:hypothetical protein
LLGAQRRSNLVPRDCFAALAMTTTRASAPSYQAHRSLASYQEHRREEN